MAGLPEPGAGGQVGVLGAGEAVALLGRGLGDEAVGVLAGRPLLLVRLDEPGAEAELADLARFLPAVVVGLAGEGTDLSRPPELDVLLAPGPVPPAPWVGWGDDLDGVLGQLAAAVTASPGPSVGLVQLLRFSAKLSVADALVSESLLYGLLQAGPAHRRWLAERAPVRERQFSGPAVDVERDGATLRLVLNRPEVRNAYSAAMRDDLVAGLQVGAADPGIERIELSGRGPSFSSGGDLAEFGTTPDPVTAHLVRSTRNAGYWLHVLAAKTTAVVHGACVGAGVELPAFAGRVVARPDATFHLPEVPMGLVPGAGGTVSIPRRLGRQRTAWLALTASHLDAPGALAWGLVDEVAA